MTSAGNAVRRGRRRARRRPRRDRHAVRLHGPAPPEGRDAEYLRWHTLDHRPEQHRLADVRASLRLVSTPACRAARARSDERFDEIDHVMTYFFTDQSGLKPFIELSIGAGRCGPETAPAAPGTARRLRRAAARRPRRGSRSAPTCCRGGRPAACICCWRTATTPPIGPLGVDGVGGVWSAASQPVDARLASARAGQTAHVLLPRRRPGGDRGAVATRARRRGGSIPVPNRCSRRPSIRSCRYEWDRYVP